MVLFTSCGKSFSLIIDKAQWKSYSVEELIVLYESLNVRYQDVAVIVMENNTIKQIMIDSKEEVVSIDSIMEKEYFSDEEWQKVEDLFRTTGMNRIERSIKSGKDAIIFIYRNSNFTTELFYCVTTDEQDLLYHKQRTTVFQKIDDNWWVGYSSDNNSQEHTTQGDGTQGDGSSVLPPYVQKEKQRPCGRCFCLLDQSFFPRDW